MTHVVSRFPAQAIPCIPPRLQTNQPQRSANDKSGTNGHLQPDVLPATLGTCIGKNQIVKGYGWSSCQLSTLSDSKSQSCAHRPVIKELVLTPARMWSRLVGTQLEV